jgi:hypothetical protein
MNELPNKEEIKELYLRTIINEIYKQISEFNKSITIPCFVYNIFQDKLKEKGYFINSVIEDDNVIINIPLDDDNKITETKELPYAYPSDLKEKQFTEKILNDIIANKLDFNVELYKYTDYNIFADYMIKIYTNILNLNDDNKLIKYIIDNNYYKLNNMLFSTEQSHILRYFNFDIIIYLIDKGVVFIDTVLLNNVKEDKILNILSYAMMYKPFVMLINIFDPTYIKCWKIFNYRLLEIYIENSNLKYYVKVFDNYSKDIMKNLLIDNNNMDFNNKLEITKLLIKKLKISK